MFSIFSFSNRQEIDAVNQIKHFKLVESDEKSNQRLTTSKQNLKWLITSK